jgi:hypothetical protein
MWQSHRPLKVPGGWKLRDDGLYHVQLFAQGSTILLQAELSVSTALLPCISSARQGRTLRFCACQDLVL